MEQTASKLREHSWPSTVFRKWLNINNNYSEYNNAEEDSGGDDFEEDQDNQVGPYKLRRSNSETFRAQYIDNKELRVCVGTWNVGGKVPSEDLDIRPWLDFEDPADIYVLGIQEIVPLNAGNIFGSEDTRPVQIWESIIRDTLNKVQPSKPNYKSYSNPSSPSRFKPSDEASAIADDLLPGTDTDTDEEENTFDPDTTKDEDEDLEIKKRSFSGKFSRCSRINFVDYEVPDTEVSQEKKLTRMLSSSERVGLVWPEQSLDLKAKSFKSTNTFRASRSFKFNDVGRIEPIAELNLDDFSYKKKRSSYVKLVSKQMVGIYLTIWIRRPLRKYVQNLKVSAVGVGIMGLIGNKGSVSISMSVYQTPFCFICSHLSSGEKFGDEIRRNSDVHEIHRRTRFCASPYMGLPQTIHNHERIFWLGDLNYRINIPYERTHELISKKKWSELLEGDQLKQELRKGHTFEGWSEGHIKFPPTYKYEFNSGKYIADDLKGGRRTPAWCDRILTYGNGMKLLSYRRSDLRLSDHRPVTATFTAEVEVFSHRKLQKALTLTDAEIEDGDIISDMDIAVSLNRLRLGEDTSGWGR